MISISTWKPIWASTRSSRPKCSPPFASSTTSRATRIANCATIPTIGHVIRFVYEMRPDLAGGNAQQPPIANQQPAMATESETASSPVSIPTPTLAAPPAISPAATDEAIQARVLEIVAEKTGYPKEMLDLDLDLEADLGIDTVKQAEMFASVRAAYNIPRDENLKLRDFPTLAHVIKFAQQGAAGAKAAHAKAANAIPARSRSDSSFAVAPQLRSGE